MSLPDSAVRDYLERTYWHALSFVATYISCPFKEAVSPTALSTEVSPILETSLEERDRRYELKAVEHLNAGPFIR